MGSILIYYLTRIKVDVPNSTIALNWAPTFEWYVVRCGSKNEYQKDMLKKKLDYVLKVYNIHSKPNNQHNWGNLYDHLTSTRIFNSIMNKIFT
jgi:hypothetical protein